MFASPLLSTPTLGYLQELVNRIVAVAGSVESCRSCLVQHAQKVRHGIVVVDSES